MAQKENDTKMNIKCAKSQLRELASILINTYKYVRVFIFFFYVIPRPVLIKATGCCSLHAYMYMVGPLKNVEYLAQFTEGAVGAVGAAEAAGGAGAAAVGYWTCVPLSRNSLLMALLCALSQMLLAP